MSRRRNRAPTQRRSTTTELGFTAQDVAAELLKAINGYPTATMTDATTRLQAIGATTTSGQQIVGQAQPLFPGPGGWGIPQVPFGPGTPTRPAAINPLDAGTGRPDPRRWEAPVSWNLPGGDRHLPWSALRALSNVGIIRKCIETRKKQLTQLDWDFVVAESVFEEAQLRSAASPKALEVAKRAAIGDPQAKADQAKANAVSKAQLEADFRAANADAIFALRDWWAKPDRVMDWSWESWLNAMMEERLVLDAIAIYPKMTLGGDLHSFMLIDGATIKPLLDDYAAIPAAPNPAFQQILHGFARGEFTATAGPDGEYSRDTLIYRVANTRVGSPYGLGPTEIAIQDADLYLKRRAWMSAEYDEGVMPELMIKVDAAMTPDQLRAYERVFNDMLSGNTRERHRARLLPKGFDPVPMASMDERYKDGYDLFLIRMICLDFDIMPTEMGFPPSSGLGGAGFSDGEENSQFRRSIRPDAGDISSLINDLSAGWLTMPKGLTHQFLGLEAEDEAAALAAMEGALSKGAITVNEARDKLGKPRYDVPEADMPLIITGRDVIPLAGAVDRANANAQKVQAMGQPGGQPGQGPQPMQPLAGAAQQPGQGGPQGNQGGGNGPAAGGTNGGGQGGQQGGGQQGKAANPKVCPCGQPVAWFGEDGWGHADGSVSHDGDFYGQSVSDLVGTTPPRAKTAATEHLDLSGRPGPSVAGLAVLAANTGRVLMLQRAMLPNDPAGGSWEFPGGHLEEGEDALTGAQREWAEEVGQPVPAGEQVGSWTSPDGRYAGHLWRVPAEADVNINADPDDRHVLNPDDPDGDMAEVVAWWEPDHLDGNPAVRRELAGNMPAVRGALATVADTSAADKAAEARRWREHLRNLRRGRTSKGTFRFVHHPSYIAAAANDLAGEEEWAAAAAVLDVVLT